MTSAACRWTTPSAAYQDSATAERDFHPDCAPTADGPPRFDDFEILADFGDGRGDDSRARFLGIVGAFAAGLILHEDLFVNLRAAGQGLTIKELVRLFEIVLAPIFFVTMELQVRLETLLSADVILLAAALTLAAGIAKLASGWGSESGSNRWLVGLGMMPRGEVALIFATSAYGTCANAYFRIKIAALLLACGSRKPSPIDFLEGLRRARRMATHTGRAPS